MKIFFLCCVIFLKLSAAATAQITVQNGRGFVGDQVAITLVIVNSAEKVIVSGEFILSNPTVFYPETFLNGGDSVSLQKMNDSLYRFSFRTRSQALLLGELLAGSDSICEISFKNITVNNTSVADFKGIIIAESIGAPLPYVRPASFAPGFPNPASRGQQATWSYRIDQRSNVRFSFHTLLGKEILSVDLGEKDTGTHPFSLVPDIFFSAGVYWVRLVTNSGESLQRMMVIP